MEEAKQKSDLSRAFSEDGALKTHVGGQALLEGIMMGGKYNWSVAVREPEGTIYLEEHDLAYGKDKSGWLYWPFIRGCRAFVESLMLGYKALSISAEHAFVEEEEETPKKPTRQEEDGFSWKRDFGNPDEMIDGLAAQRTLEVIDGETGLPVRFEEEEPADTSGDSDIPDTQNAPTIPYVPEAPDVRNVPDTPDIFDASGTAAPEISDDRGAEAGERPESKPLLGEKEMLFSMVLGLVLGIVLFIVAPATITNFIVGEYDDNTLLWNIVDGLLRIAVFIFYIWLIGRMSDIKRMFGYHGAEHKAIHCYEHGLPMTPENARSFPRLHVRCGTAFLIMVMIIAIFVYTITPINALIDTWGVPDGPVKLALVIVVRILLMPLIAGISYEITVKWAGSHPDNALVKVILWPGMQMQYLTTREPDDEMIECAIAAMQLVLEREELEEQKGREAVSGNFSQEATALDS